MYYDAEERYLPPDVAQNVLRRLPISDLRSARYVSRSFREQSVPLVRSSEERKLFDRDMTLVRIAEALYKKRSDYVRERHTLPWGMWHSLLELYGVVEEGIHNETVLRELDLRPDGDYRKDFTAYERFLDARLKYFRRASIKVGAQRTMAIPQEYPTMRDLMEEMERAIAPHRIKEPVFSEPIFHDDRITIVVEQPMRRSIRQRELGRYD